jgi:chemotaxis methyl-accepting protein methylase
MLRLGIVDRSALVRPTTRFGARRHVSALLLHQLSGMPESDEAAYDGVVEQLPMPNGTWKFTCRGRFAGLDRLVLDLLAARAARGARISVIDLAASTGVTSVELYRLLRERYAVSFLASDLYRDLYAVRRRGAWVGMFTATGDDVQHVVWRFVLPGQLTESWAYPANRVLRAACRRLLAPRARAVLGRAPLSRLGPFETVRVDGFEIRRLPLLSGACLALATGDENFRFEVHDVCQPLPERATVVRAMNILTREHFDDDTRARIVRHCMEATLPGGLLVLGWSPWQDPAQVEASIYEVTGDGLERLASVNGGSEIDRFVESIVPTRGGRRTPVAV